jgi:glycosyltransferase involved in cell wall biosynthesis
MTADPPTNGRANRSSSAGKRPPRVLAVGPIPPPTNGMSVAFEVLRSGLVERGWNPIVVDIADRGDRSKPYQRLWRALVLVRAIARAVVGMWSVQLVYLTISQSRAGFLRDAPILVGARVLRIPAVVHLHGGNFDGFYRSQPRIVQAFIRALLGKVSRIIVLSEGLKATFSMIPSWPELTIAIPNPCATTGGRERRLPIGRVRILYLSNLMVEKGFLDLIEALHLLPALLPDREVHLDLAGALQLVGGAHRTTGELEHELRQRIASLPAGVTAQWHGVVTGGEKDRLLDEADVFVLPTYYRNEGQPIAILEALSKGIPIVTTAHRGIPEVLPPAMTEFLVPPRDPAAIAGSLARLITSASYEEASREALRAARRFTPEGHLDLVTDVLTRSAR